MLERPLFLALIAGVVTGQWHLVIPLGIVFELLWLDSIPLGSVVSPQASFSFLLLLPIALRYQWPSPSPYMLPLIFAGACAYLGAWCERALRLRQNRYLETLKHWCVQTSHEGNLPERLVAANIFQRFLLQFACFVPASLFIQYGTEALLRHDLLLQVRLLTWPVLYAVCTTGAIFVLRIRHAYDFFLASLLLPCRLTFFSFSYFSCYSFLVCHHWVARCSLSHEVKCC